MNPTTFKLGHPIENFSFTENVSQLFGVGKGRYFYEFGLPGHNGLDIVQTSDKLGYGTKILAAHEWDAVRAETDFPSKKRGTGLWLRKKLDVPVIVNGIPAHYVETAYWHLADFAISVTGASTGKKGDVVALMGNTGYVSPKPSTECATCPYNGTHVHFGVSFYDEFFRVIESEYPNGYRDPVPFMYQDGDRFNMHFGRNLAIGSEGDDVAHLQTLLKLEGLGKDYEPIGYFGRKTLRDVIALQSRLGLNAIGFVGPKTLAYLKEKYVALT